MKYSYQRTFCRSEIWFKKARQGLSSVPFSTHCLSRRLTALLEPYRWESLLQGAPVHKIQRIPSKHKRSSLATRSPLRQRLLNQSPLFIGQRSPGHRHLHDLVSYATT
jgi:hypothetical protein